eukprot:TRINITY_DN53131_c0_g1_i1.p1 TRINITY_DN53131_c0_g1~~TRINITY_DN53131_c0_g1_i1.p1  ORF type:complete len:193 (+),score=41.91 TRINITY_DN53131_c0_g1_i1:28-579(+)
MAGYAAADLEHAPLSRQANRSRTNLSEFALPELKVNSTEKPIVVVHASWNSYFVDPVLKACKQVLQDAHADHTLVSVPGASELVAGCRKALKDAAAVVCIAVLIRGESDVYRNTCASVMQGIMHLNAQQDVPVVSGVLMCQDEAQAEQRTVGPENPGVALAESALFMAQVCSRDSPDERAKGS